MHSNPISFNKVNHINLKISTVSYLNRPVKLKHGQIFED